jgi:hypothetical protein
MGGTPIVVTVPRRSARGLMGNSLQGWGPSLEWTYGQFGFVLPGGTEPADVQFGVLL